MVVDVKIYCPKTARSKTKIASRFFNDKTPFKAQDYVNKKFRRFLFENRHLFHFTSYSFILRYQIPWATFIFLYKVKIIFGGVDTVLSSIKVLMKVGM